MMKLACYKKMAPVGYYTGKMILVLAAAMTIPLLTSIFTGELLVVLDFTTSICTSLTVGFILLFFCRDSTTDLSWPQGMAVVSLTWLVSTVLAAQPYYLSGYWYSYLDAMFDVMSGLTTTGLILVQNLDHMPYGVNMWRHLLTWTGGQGIIVLALSFVFRSTPGAYRLYVGEGKDERLLPNVISTAKAIWYVSIVYLIIGTVSLWLVGMGIGQQPGRAFLHAMWVFMGAWSTGGFAPQNQNLLYYHSLPYEVLTIIFMIIGSFNFHLHWAVMSGNRREIYKNLETVTFAITSTLLGAIAMWELARLGVYHDAISVFRRGYYSLISAHTTTGFATIYAREFILEWGPLALAAMIAAMLFGGSASSTAGGFKAVRIGITVKAVVQEVRRMLYPEATVLVEKIHLGREVVLEDKSIRMSLIIIVLYIVTWVVSGSILMAYGYDPASSFFEAASAVGNVGLSCGLTSPAMPDVAKSMMIVSMWVGRLEFMAVFVFIGFLFGRGRR